MAAVIFIAVVIDYLINFSSHQHYYFVPTAATTIIAFFDASKGVNGCYKYNNNNDNKINDNNIMAMTTITTVQQEFGMFCEISCNTYYSKLSLLVISNISKVTTDSP
jgi:purine-cytosine permease-like protein